MTNNTRQDLFRLLTDAEQVASTTNAKSLINLGRAGLDIYLNDPDLCTNGFVSKYASILAAGASLALFNAKAQLEREKQALTFLPSP